MGGLTAATADFNNVMEQRAPLVIGFVLVLVFVLLLFHSARWLGRRRRFCSTCCPSLRPTVCWSWCFTATAGVVTAAATVMVFVFRTFATLSQVSLKQAGVGLAVAELIDATVVRGVLLPATMVLLGSRDCYLPRWLAWFEAHRWTAASSAA